MKKITTIIFTSMFLALTVACGSESEPDEVGEPTTTATALVPTDTPKSEPTSTLVPPTSTPVTTDVERVTTPSRKLPTLTPTPANENALVIIHELQLMQWILPEQSYFRSDPLLDSLADDVCDGYFDDDQDRLFDDVEFVMEKFYQDRVDYQVTEITAEGIREGKSSWCPPPRPSVTTEAELWDLWLEFAERLGEIDAKCIAYAYRVDNELEPPDAAWLEHVLPSVINDTFGEEYSMPSEFQMTVAGYHEAYSRHCAFSSESELWDFVIGGDSDEKRQSLFETCLNYHFFAKKNDHEYAREWLTELSAWLETSVSDAYRLSDFTLTVDGLETTMNQYCPNVRYELQSELEAWDIIIGPFSPFIEFRQWYCIDNRLETGDYEPPPPDTLDDLHRDLGEVLDVGEVRLTGEGFQEAAHLYCTVE